MYVCMYVCLCVYIYIYIYVRKYKCLCLLQILRLEEYMLYAHGSDLCHDLELRHAMANCFEALMGALFLDGGIEV